MSSAVKEVKQHLLRVGDAVPRYWIGHSTGGGELHENTTVIAVKKIPKNRDKRDALIKSLITSNTAVISGENLADDPKIAPRVKRNYLYVFES